MKNLNQKRAATAIVALITSLGATAHAAPLVSDDFETGASNWVGIGAAATLVPATGADNVHGGQGALRFDYRTALGQINALAKPLEFGALKDLKSLSLWVKSDHNASLMLILQEEGGGRFATVFSAPANKWQQVEVAPDELILQRGADDPHDENGQLDLDRVNALALADFDQILIQATADRPETVAKLFQIKPGARTLYLDDLTLSAGALAATDVPAVAGETILDDFHHPQLAWLGIGDLTIQRNMADAGVGHELQAGYRQEPNHIIGLIKPLQMGVLKDKTSLNFDIASTRALTLIVQVEEEGGGKYSLPIQIEGGGDTVAVAANFAEFKPSDDSTDANGQLDLDQVSRLILVDISGFIGASNGDNALWLSAVRAK